MSFMIRSVSQNLKEMKMLSWSLSSFIVEMILLEFKSYFFLKFLKVYST